MPESTSNSKNQPRRHQRGGKREGAGRPKGRKDRATLAEIVNLETEARRYSVIAIEALLDVAEKGESESARVNAASALLDRGYGRPRQAIEHSGTDGSPLAISVTHTIIDPHAG